MSMQFDPVLLDIAEQLETERLLIRATRAGDGAQHFAAVQESITDLRRYLGDLPWIKEEPSKAHSESYCRKARSRFIKREDLTFLMITKANEHLVGGIGLHRIDWTIPKFEIGYWCRSSAQGNGYVVEAVNAITDFAFSQLEARRVEIRADDDNTASWKVAERAGFDLEGTLRNFLRDTASQQLSDLRVYSKIIK